MRNASHYWYILLVILLSVAFLLLQQFSSSSSSSKPNYSYNNESKKAEEELINEDHSSLSPELQRLAQQVSALEKRDPKNLPAKQYENMLKYLRKIRAKNLKQTISINTKTHPTSVLPVPPCKYRRKYQLSQFCAPNLDRYFHHQTPKAQPPQIYPISYGIPKQFILQYKNRSELIQLKTQITSQILPSTSPTTKPSTKKKFGNKKFTNQTLYYQEYSKSYYCIDHKKGGWDSLRHWEIIASGCMPYFIDLEYCPEYTLYHLPKQLLIEARELPGVTFNCEEFKVEIDFKIFPKERYFDLLEKLLAHARKYLTTEAMAKYVLEDVLKIGEWKKTKTKTNNNTTPLKILYLQKRVSKASRKGRGSYNSWLLLHGLREYFSNKNNNFNRREGIVVDAEPIIKFLYKEFEFVYKRDELYGKGFSYAFLMENDKVGDQVKFYRSNLLPRVPQSFYQTLEKSTTNETFRKQLMLYNDFDIIIYSDPLSLGNPHHQNGMSQNMLEDLLFSTTSSSSSFSLLSNVKKVVLLQPFDVPHPNKIGSNVDMRLMYDYASKFPEKFVILQREIGDCHYVVPRLFLFNNSSSSSLRKAELLKQCLYYQTANCNDDVFLIGREDKWKDWVF